MRSFTLPEDGCHAGGSCGRRVDVCGRMCEKCRGVPVGCPAGSLGQGWLANGCEQQEKWFYTHRFRYKRLPSL